MSVRQNPFGRIGEFREELLVRRQNFATADGVLIDFVQMATAFQWDSHVDLIGLLAESIATSTLPRNWIDLASRTARSL